MDTDKPKRKVDEATLRRLAEGRLKGLETRRKRMEIKKQEKAEQMEKLNRDYQEKVLKKKDASQQEEPQGKRPSAQPIEETNEEIYPNTHHIVESDCESDREAFDARHQDHEAPIKKNTRKPSGVVHKDTTPNYKQEYYRAKLEKLKNAQEESSFINQYARLPTYAHMADVAKSQITQRVNQEVLQRVYKDLFGGQ